MSKRKPNPIQDEHDRRAAVQLAPQIDAHLKRFAEKRAAEILADAEARYNAFFAAIKAQVTEAATVAFDAANEPPTPEGFVESLMASKNVPSFLPTVTDAKMRREAAERIADHYRNPPPKDDTPGKPNRPVGQWHGTPWGCQ